MLRKTWMIAVAALLAAIGVALWTLATPNDPASTDAGLRPKTVDSAPVTPKVDTADVAQSAPAVAREHAESSKGSADAHAVLIVRDAFGEPGAEWPLVLVRGDKATRIETDAEGVCRLPASGDDVEVYVRGSAGRPFRQSIALTPGEHVLQEPPGAVVAGVVFVNGALPAVPVRIELHSDRKVADGEELSPAIVAALYGSMLPDLFQSTHTDAQGRFRVGGLPRGFDGWLSVNDWIYEPVDPAVDPERGWWMPVPREDLVLHVRRRIRIHGRVVDAAGAPLDRVHVEAGVDQGPAGGMSLSLWTTEGGRFEFPLRPPTPRSVRIEIDGGPEHGRKTLLLTDGLDRDVDLGDVPLAVEAFVRFRAVDVEGAPVAGAMGASPAERGHRRGSPSGPDGRGHFVPRPGDRHMWVLAPGCDVATVPLPGDDREVVVALTRATRLEVVVMDSAGRPLKGASVELRADSHLTTDPRGGLTIGAIDEKAETASRSLHWEDEASGLQSVGCSTDRNGRVGIARLRPHAAFQLIVRDPLGSPLMDDRLTLNPGEARKVEVHAPGRMRRVWGTVVSDRGRPLGHARVGCFADPAKPGPSVWTDAYGAFAFDDVLVKSVLLRVECEDHARLELPDVLVPPDGRELQITLRPGFDVTLHVIDGNGTELESVPVTASCPGLRDPIRPQQPFGKLHVFTMLPAGTVRFSAQLGRRDYAMDHDAQVPEATLTVPVFGQLEVSLPNAEAYRTTQRLRLQSLSTPDDAFTGNAQWPSQDAERVRHRVRFVLPGRYDVYLETRRGEEPWQAAGTWRDVAVAAGAATHLDETTLGGPK